MKVTLVPAHMVVADAEILTLAVRMGFTTMVSVVEVAGLPVTQVALEVIIQLMVFPFTRVLLE